jgi:hypothetical protein
MRVFTILTFELVDRFLRKFVRILRHKIKRPNTVTYYVPTVNDGNTADAVTCDVGAILLPHAFRIHKCCM